MRYLLPVVLFFLILPLHAQETSFLDLYAQYLNFYGTEKIYDTRIQDIKGDEDKILIYDPKTFELYKDSINTDAIQRVSVAFTKEMDLQKVFNDLAIFPNLFYLKMENQKLFGDPILLEFPKDLSGISGVGFINFFGSFGWDFNHVFSQLQELERLKYLALLSFGEDYVLAENVSLLSNLEGLSLSGRYGSGIPEAVSELKNLKSLVLSADLFPDFQEQMEKFKSNPKLKELLLKSFKLVEEDHGVFKKFTSIERFELHNVEVANLDELLLNFSENKNLKHLEIFGTKTSNFSTGLQSFEKLKYLRLERIGEGIVVPHETYQLKDLENLIISSNKTFLRLDKSIKNLNNLRELTVYFSSLKYIPEEIGRLSNLEKLNLRHNQIEKLPEEISHLSSLREFYLDNNRLEMLPAETGNLKNLQVLHLQRNLLKELPSSFSKLEALEILNLEENDLKNLSRDFGNLKSLENLMLSKNLLQELPGSFGNLRNLQILFLDNNNLKELPAGIGHLKELKSIYLHNHRNNAIYNYDLSTDKLTKDTSRIERKRNRIEYLPIGFSELQNIRTIRLEGNPIDASALFNVLKNLKSEKYHLDLANCEIKELPQTGWESILVESLDLTNNRIQSLPRNIMKAPHLETLSLSGNPIGEFSRVYPNKEQLIIAFYEAGFIEKDDIPEDEKIAEALLKIGYGKKDPREKLEFFEHAYSIDPAFTDASIRPGDYADALLQGGDFEKAIKYYDKAIAKDTARGPYILNFIFPHFQNRARAHLAVGDTLSAIKGLEHVSQRFNSGDWAKAAILARDIGKDSLASRYFQKGEEFYKNYIQNNLEAGRVDYGYHLSLLELYIVQEDFTKAAEYLELLKSEQISEKDKQLLLEYLDMVVAILQDEAEEVELNSLSRKIFNANTKISSWSFDLVKVWLESTGIDGAKTNKIWNLTLAMENMN